MNTKNSLTQSAKNHFIVLLILVVGLQSNCIIGQENSFNANSIVDKVTVFLTGAELNHVSKIKLKKGKNNVTFNGLSAKLDEGSINLTPENNDVTVLYLKTKLNYLDTKKENDVIKKLQDSLEFYNDKSELIKLEIETLETEKGLLFKNQSIGGQVGATVLETEKAADFYRKRCAEINAMILKSKKNKNYLDASKLKFRKQLNELNNEINPPTSDIVVTLLANRDLESTINFKYNVPTAGWTPKYDLRTEGTGKPVKLVYRGVLFNNSGLDWKDIKITLSTANPQVGIDAPTLSNWYLGQEQMPAVSANIEDLVNNQNGVVSNSELNEVEIVYDSDKNFGNKKRKQIPKVQFQKIEVDMLSTEFTIDQPYSIFSDSKPYTVDVLEKNVPALYEYKAVPSLEKEAFLQAKMSLADLPDLVTGEASVYFGGSFIGKTIIKTLDLEDSLNVSLGRDKKIQITRKELKKEFNRVIVGNNEKQVLKYEITFKNTRDATIFLVVEDQIPLATNSDEDITLNESSNAEYDKATGKLVWKFLLAPNETKLIKMGYTSKYPKYKKMRRKYRTVSSPSF